VAVDYSDLNNVLLSSTIDNTSLVLRQLNEISELNVYHGSNDPMRGWQSTTFNEVSPITTLNYQLSGESVSFETIINIGLNITDVDSSQDGDTDIYIFEFDNNRIERIEINH